MVHRGATNRVAAGWQAGADAFALKLVGLLHEKVRARPNSYHGGLFISRDCHTIGDNSALLCAALDGKALQRHVIAYAEAWRLCMQPGPNDPEPRRHYPRGRGHGVSRGYGSHGNPFEG